MATRHRRFVPRFWVGMASVILACMSAACDGSTAPATASASTSEPGLDAPRTYALGRFPEFPRGPLTDPTAAALQAVLDEAVENGTFTGVTATVIVADRGSWTGAAGSMDGAPVTPGLPSPDAQRGQEHRRRPDTPPGGGGQAGSG